MSAADAGHDTLTLNEEALTVTIGSAPTLQGTIVVGNTVTVPTKGACAVAFVEVEYAHPVAACMMQST